MYIMQADYFRDSTGVTTIAIPSTGVVYTKAKKIAMHSVFGLAATLASSGSPTVKVEVEVSDTAPSAKEAIADSAGTDWCIQEGGSAIYSALADKVLHKISLSLVASVYCRLKLTGNSGNPSDTTGVFALVNQQQL